MTAEKLYKLGIEDAKKSETFSSAMTYFKEAIALCEKGDKSISIVQCYWKISELQRSKNLGTAYTACETALLHALPEEKAECNFRLGEIALAMSWPLASSYFKRAKKLYADNTLKALCDYKIGLVEAEVGGDNEAIKAFLSAIEGFKNNDIKKAECYFHIGLIHFNKRNIMCYQLFKIKTNLPAAIAALNYAIELATPSNNKLPTYHFYRGWAYASQGDFQKAIEDYTNALTFRANLSAQFVEKVRFKRAVLYVNKGEWESAIQDYNSIFQADPKATFSFKKESIRKLVTNCPEFYEKTLKNRLPDDEVKYAEQIKASIANPKANFFLPKKYKDGRNKLQLEFLGNEFEEMKFD